MVVDGGGEAVSRALPGSRHVTVDEKRVQSGERDPLYADDQLHRKVAASVNVLFVVALSYSCSPPCPLPSWHASSAWPALEATARGSRCTTSPSLCATSALAACLLANWAAVGQRRIPGALDVARPTQWSLAVGIGVVVFALIVGLAATRVQVLLVLVPGIALFGLSGVRQVFYARYQTARLGRIDIATNVVQLFVVPAWRSLGGGPWPSPPPFLPCSSSTVSSSRSSG